MTHDVKINDVIFDETENKRQIILTNTFRTESDFIKQLKYRYNGENKKIPHFFVNKKGDVTNLLNSNVISDFFAFNGSGEESIFISLENLGWVERVSTKDYYSNFLGYIKKTDIYEKKWRDYFFWDIYSDEQINATANLCKQLLVQYKMKNKFIGHNTKLTGIETYNGIVCKSNYSTYYTDVSPSFPFVKFTNLIENE